MKNFYSVSIALLIAFTSSGCQTPDFGKLKEKSASLLSNGESDNKSVLFPAKSSQANEVLQLSEILKGSGEQGELGSTFKSAFSLALKTDPAVISARRDFESKKAAITSVEARKEFQVSGTVYGGIEDVTDRTAGVALSLSASRLLFDGGEVDSTIAEKGYIAEAARQQLKATLDARALSLGIAWIELERYEALQDLIDGRLEVLNPLINQLERVANAGIGDVSKVTSAQRTVSEIRVAKTNVSEGLAQARLNFINAFGLPPNGITYGDDFVANLMPDSINDEMIINSPIIASKYSLYLAGNASLNALKVRDDFNVGFELRASRPIGESDVGSDESVGLVAKKTLFNGGMLEADLKAAEANLDAVSAEIKAAHRELSRTVFMSKQNVVSMDKAIALAIENATLTSDEIVYLRQQLVIGGSTLESVLSAESRLYDAESKVINFEADKRRSEVTIVSSLGLLAPALGFGEVK